MVRSGLFSVLFFLEMFLGYAQSLGDKETVVYPAPSDKFVSIAMQIHEGLPRFGVPNSYQKQIARGNMGLRTARPVRVKRNPVILEQNKAVTSSKNNFALLVGLKYLRPFMKDLDRERLITMTSDMSEKEANSAFLQRFLLHKVAPNLCLAEECKNANQGKNEFERLRNYKSFVDTCLDPLLDWSQNIMEGDELTGYHVSLLKIGSNYDFDKKGYWVYHSLWLNDIFPMREGIPKRVDFEPIQPFEVMLHNTVEGSKTIEFLLRMDEQTAESFQKEGIGRLYVAKKIKVKRSNKPMGSPSQTMEFKYAHESTDLEIYTDEGLTQHFKTLSLADLTHKID